MPIFCTSCQPSQSLTDYGVLNKGISHHVVISFNDSLLTIHVSGGGKANYTQSWSRASTFSHHVRSVVPVWWMSTKFGTSEYNLGNGTFSNIKITFSDFGTTTTLAPTTDKPTLQPTARPTELPTFSPSTVPTENRYPTAGPTMKPTTNPTVNPTNEPTVQPSSSPVRPPISVVYDDDDDQDDDEGLSSSETPSILPEVTTSVLSSAHHLGYVILGSVMLFVGIVCGFMLVVICKKRQRRASFSPIVPEMAMNGQRPVANAAAMMELQNNEHTVMNHKQQMMLHEHIVQRLSDDDDSGSDLFVEMGPGVNEDTPMSPGNGDKSNQQVQRHVVDTRSDPPEGNPSRTDQSTIYH